MLEDGLSLLTLIVAAVVLSLTKGVPVGEQSQDIVRRHDGSQPLAQWTKGSLGPIPVQLPAPFQ